MSEKNNQFPEWSKPILNHLFEKPYRYRLLIDDSFVIKAVKHDPTDGYAFGLGFLFSEFLFSEGLCPEEMESNLRIYKIVETVAQAESLDLIGRKKPLSATRYRRDLPLKTLAIGYLGKQPSLQEIDKVFSAYDTIEARIKE